MVPALKQQEALLLLHRCLDEGRIIPGKHFRDELAAEKLELTDALAVLRKGRIYDPPEHDVKSGDWKYRIEGNEPAGRRMAIVFCFKRVDTAFLITIFSIREC